MQGPRSGRTLLAMILRSCLVASVLKGRGGKKGRKRETGIESEGSTAGLIPRRDDKKLRIGKNIKRRKGRATCCGTSGAETRREDVRCSGETCKKLTQPALSHSVRLYLKENVH